MICIISEQNLEPLCGLPSFFFPLATKLTLSQVEAVSLAWDLKMTQGAEPQPSFGGQVT